MGQRAPKGKNQDLTLPYALIEQDLAGVLTLEGSVNARDHTGGTAPAQVRKAAQQARMRI